MREYKNRMMEINVGDRGKKETKFEMNERERGIESDICWDRRKSRRARRI